MLFYSYFKTVVGKEVRGRTGLGTHTIPLPALLHTQLTVSTAILCFQVTVELKNDLSITGVLHSVDQYLNVKLNNIKVLNPEKYPHMLSVRNCFVRGSVVRYIQVRSGEKRAFCRYLIAVLYAADLSPLVSPLPRAVAARER